MFGYYTPVLILQAFCLYHAFKNHNDYKWFLLIIFLPIIGCIIYLYLHFANKISVEGIKEEVKQVVNSNYKIEQLEKESQITDTFSNKIKLAQEYLNKARYSEALDILETCQEGIHKDDPELLIALVKAYYLNQQYQKAIEAGQKLKNNLEFKDSVEKIAYAWSLSKAGQKEKAFETFEEMDMPYSKYPHRLEFSRFLIEENRVGEAKEKLEELLDEISHMDGYEKRQKRGIQNEIKQVYQSL